MTTAVGFYNLTYDSHTAVGYCEHVPQIGTDPLREHWTVLYEAPGGDGLMHPHAVTYDPVHNQAHTWTVGALITTG